ncbi:copper homeostasis protein CutC [Capnocytophaga genosp. AHN8471]|uniref:copper homeostasis protein CutC n=1 Tax=Capnocytophaga genosp. AHN8471 TaxID=327574 RepID=UPI0019342D7B|nr:copper homeostasis protein CutC [Capnocytophaga genosp. AHN8471]MBM0657791.1 copper homeostasis protein CutC [Capnocytophaga genosp. AHN8471]
MIYEICASSFESAKNAEIAGAIRIELCSELGVGGVTPSYGLIKKVMDELSIGNCVLIRPRSGNFTYTDEEFDVMLRDINLCRELGCQGVVTGVLHRDNTIDEERTARLKEAAGTMEFIYHRAFDCAPDPIAAIKTLKRLGVERILTSGGKKSAIEGLELLKELNRIAAGQPTIMPGGGINRQSIIQIKVAGFTQVHFSGTVFEDLGTSLPFSFKTEAFLDETKRPISNVENIKKIMNN